MPSLSWILALMLSIVLEESDSLACEGLDKNLHTTAEMEDKMEGGLLLNIVMRKGVAILKLLTSKN